MHNNYDKADFLLLLLMMGLQDSSWCCSCGVTQLQKRMHRILRSSQQNITAASCAATLLNNQHQEHSSGGLKRCSTQRPKLSFFWCPVASFLEGILLCAHNVIDTIQHNHVLPSIITSVDQYQQAHYNQHNHDHSI
jgi:hypothetical protein